MSKEKMQENCAAMAEHIEEMVQALQRRGFTETHAVRMVTGMLSASHVYIPFASMTEGSTAQSFH